MKLFYYMYNNYVIVNIKRYNTQLEISLLSPSFTVKIWLEVVTYKTLKNPEENYNLGSSL